MQHTILPLIADQALELIQQLRELIDVLHNAYHCDFIDMANNHYPPRENQIELFDDPLDF